MTEQDIMSKRYDLEILKLKVQIKELELQIEQLNFDKKGYQEQLEETAKPIEND